MEITEKTIENLIQNGGYIAYTPKEIIDGAIDSPLALTYLGLDSLNFLTGHKSKLGDYSLEKSESDYEESLKQLNYLNRFNINPNLKQD